MAAQPMKNVRPRPAKASDHDSDESEAEQSLNDPDNVEMDHQATDEDVSDSATSHHGEPEVDVETQISNVSFGALKQAQDTITRKRKRGSDSMPDQENKLEALRERLRQIKQREATSKKSSGKAMTARPDSDDEHANSGSDSESAPSEEGAQEKSRSSKHAPMSQSTRYQVSRKRQVVEVPKRVVRDPRFDALHQQSLHPGNSEKAYSFIQDYQKSEIAELKEARKKAKTDVEKESLKWQIERMENRIKSKEAEERKQEILRKHRKEERIKIEQGKNPFYLKRKDINERAVEEKFKSMKAKDRERLLERRRRKEGQKEKKRMPDARRFPG